MLLLFALIAVCFLETAHGTTCVAGGGTLHQATSQVTADPPAFVSGSSGFLGTSNDDLTLFWNWASYAIGDRSIIATSSGFVLLSSSTGALCSDVGSGKSSDDGSWLLSGANNAETSSLGGLASCLDSLTSVFSWSAAKTACGNTYFLTTGADVNFIYRITYTEVIYDTTTGDSTGTRTVQQDYEFTITTPSTFTVTSSAPVTLFGTTALVTSQSLVQDSTVGSILIGFTVMSDCGNAISVTSLAPAVVTGAPASTAVVTGSPSASKGSAASSGTFTGLCPFTFSYTITPTPTAGPPATCNVNGGYLLTIGITFAGVSGASPATYPIILASSDTCAKIGLTVASASPTLQLYHTTAAASTVPGTVGEITTGQTVSLGDTAHWRIVFPPTIGTPLVVSWALTSVSWATTSGGAATGTDVTSAVEESTSLTAGTTVATSTPPISTDISYLYFKHGWDSSFTSLSLTAGPLVSGSGGFSETVYIYVQFTVTYASTRDSPARSVQHATTSKLERRSSSSSNAVSAGHALVVSGTNDSTNTALIAALATVAGILCVAGLVFAIFVLHRRRRKQAQKAATDAASTTIASAPTTTVQPENELSDEFGVINV